MTVTVSFHLCRNVTLDLQCISESSLVCLLVRAMLVIMCHYLASISTVCLYTVCYQLYFIDNRVFTFYRAACNADAVL